MGVIPTHLAALAGLAYSLGRERVQDKLPSQVLEAKAKQFVICLPNNHCCLQIERYL